MSKYDYKNERYDYTDANERDTGFQKLKSHKNKKQNRHKDKLNKPIRGQKRWI